MGFVHELGRQKTAPRWAAEFIAPKDLIPGGGRVDPAQFYAQDSVLVKAGANAIIGATSITVAALSDAIPAGTLLDFGGAGAKPAKLTAAAAKGAISLTVAALLAQVNNGDTARYAGSGLRKKVLLSGTVVGRTYAERDAGTNYGPFATTDDEIFIVPWERSDITIDADCELIRPDKSFVIYEDLLPYWSTYTQGEKDKIRSLFRCLLHEG